MLGAFHLRMIGGRAAALRDLSEASEVSAVGSETVEPRLDVARDFGKFSEWVADRAQGLERPSDYVLPASPQEIRQVTAQFTLMTSDSGTPVRWFRFDSGQNVEWKVSQGGQPGLGVDASVAAFRTALQTWDDDPGSNVRYVYTGLTSAGGGLDHDDGTNAILFNDPRGNEADGTFTCSEGGVIAVGGPFFYTSTTPLQRHRVPRGGRGGHRHQRRHRVLLPQQSAGWPRRSSRTSSGTRWASATPRSATPSCSQPRTTTAAARG